MRNLLIFPLFFLLASFYYQSGNKTDTIKPVAAEKHKAFRLSYIFAGMGSNGYSLFPAFHVIENTFFYTHEQDGFMYTPADRQKPDTILSGIFRTTSIDSIINLIKPIKDTLVYRLNSGIMSGGIDYLNISTDSIKVNFELVNTSDSIAEKIVAILNSYIPSNQRKIWLFK